MTTDGRQPNVFDPQRWGLPSEIVADVADRLRRVWTRFRPCFKTKTRDTSENAYIYLRGLLTMTTDRNYAHIAKQMMGLDDDGQNLQQFMSDSPWSAQAVFDQVQTEIAATPALRSGGVLILDESPDDKAGAKSAGAGRQHNGRLGKTEMSQVGTFLAFARGSLWTWVAAELFVPEHWFTPDMATERQRVGLPPERRFATKIELGWRMVEQAVSNGLPLECLLCDDLYGRSGWLRRKLDEAHLLYLAEVPASTQVYLDKPNFGVPPRGPRGKAPTRPRILNGVKPVEVRHLVGHAGTTFREFRVRDTERGELIDRFAMRRVWTIRDGALAEEWLVIRHEDAQRYSYALSNAPADTAHERLAELKCLRHFIECANQDAKSELGWDDLHAQKYRAWEHHTALTVLASWFIAQTKLDWAQTFARDAALAQQLEVNVLPALSMANVRELLRAALPLPQLSSEQAIDLVVKRLVNRSRSTGSRLRKQRRNRSPTSNPSDKK